MRFLSLKLNRLRKQPPIRAPLSHPGLARELRQSEHHQCLGKRNHRVAVPLVRPATEGKFLRILPEKNAPFWQDFQVFHAHNRANQNALL